MPPRLPRRVVVDSAVKVGARVGVNPVSVDRPKAKILWGWVLSRLVPFHPFALRHCRREVVCSYPRCAAGLSMCSGRMLPAVISPLHCLPIWSRMWCPLRLVSFLLRSPPPPLALPCPRFSLCVPLLVLSCLGHKVGTPPQTST